MNGELGLAALSGNFNVFNADGVYDRHTPIHTWRQVHSGEAFIHAIQAAGSTDGDKDLGILEGSASSVGPVSIGPSNEFSRISVPTAGAAPSRYVKRAFSRNRVHALPAAVRYASVLPGEDIHVFAFPLSFGGPVTDPTARITGTVLRPDNTTDVFELNDMGRLLADGGDDIDGDGTYTGVYRRANLKGSYQFLLRAELDRWRTAEGGHESDPNIVSTLR